MRLTPKELEIGTEEGFNEANDLLGYADFGRRFANLVGTIDEPLVIVVDGPWGSGKTVFAKRWAGRDSASRYSSMQQAIQLRLFRKRISIYNFDLNTPPSDL